MERIIHDAVFAIRDWLPAFHTVEKEIWGEILSASKAQRCFGAKGPWWNKNKRMIRYGDEGVTYSYKGKEKPVLEMTPGLELLRQGVEEELDHPFDCAVINYYLDGSADLYPHSDTKYLPILGEEPIIAGVSFGATRDMIFVREGEKMTIEVRHGDLIVMHGKSQSQWKHGIPAASQADPRASVTFRNHGTRKNW